jgi:hypothetical protein
VNFFDMVSKMINIEILTVQCGVPV